jgi:hypothetical protein
MLPHITGAGSQVGLNYAIGIPWLILRQVVI